MNSSMTIDEKVATRHQVALRNEQVIEGRKMALGEVSVPRQTLSVNKTKPTAPKKAVKGHEAFLKALETSGASVRLEKISSGAIIIGQVRHSDSYTVTVRVDGKDKVVFKHDISEFEAMPRRDQGAANAQ